MADDAGLEPTSAYLYTGEGEIPKDVEEVEVHPSVIEIPNSLFKDCDRLASLLLHEGLLRIGNWAFHGCSSLRTLCCPSTVRVIGWGAFMSCSNLAFVELPEGLESIDDLTFCFCTSLEEIRIPASVDRIGNDAFSGCVNLSLAELCEGLQWIGNSAFDDCRSLESIRVPSSVDFIGDRAFEDCANLALVRLKEDLEMIGKSTFKWCTSLERFEFVRLSERMEAICMDDQTKSVFDARLNEITRAMIEADHDDEEEDEEEAEDFWGKCKMSLGRAHEVLNYLELKAAAPVLELAVWKAKIEGEGGDGVQGEFVNEKARGQDLSDATRERKRLKVVNDIDQDLTLSRTDCRVKCGASIVFAGVLKFFVYSKSWPQLEY